jgi:hypothetical protein
MSGSRQFPRSEERSTDRGSVSLLRPAPGVVQTRVAGFINQELGRRIMAWVDGSIADGERPAVFHDWEEATGYETVVRQEFTTWFMGIRDAVESVHVFTRSKIVAMGVSVVALAIGATILGHRDRESFETALASAVREAQMKSRLSSRP